MCVPVTVKVHAASACHVLTASPCPFACSPSGQHMDHYVLLLTCLVLCEQQLSVASHILIPLLCLVCCVVSRCRMAAMPCTKPHKVGVWMSSSTCCQCLEQGSVRRIRTPLPCFTGQPSVVAVRWHVTSLQNSSWTHRTGTRFVGARGLWWFQSARSMCMHGLVCAVKHVVTKQVSRGQVYVQSCFMPSESYPTPCLLVLVW